MLYFKNFRVGVLAGYCRQVLRGIGGYWWVLEGIGEQRRIEIGILQRMATYTKYNILQGFIAQNAYKLNLWTLQTKHKKT